MGNSGGSAESAVSAGTDSDALSELCALIGRIGAHPTPPHRPPARPPGRTTPMTAPSLLGAMPRPVSTPPMEGLEEVT